MRRRLRVGYGFRALGALAAAGSVVTLVSLAGSCANVDTTLAPATAIDIGVTSLSVDPADFLGGVTCANTDGGTAMASYVATVIDVTDPEHHFTLPSSGPTPCSQVTYFQDVNPGDLYIAEIDGYSQAATDLVPLCGALPAGPLVNCATDDQCAEAFGCLGACNVTTFDNLSLSCLSGCGATDAEVKCASGCTQFLAPGPNQPSRDTQVAKLVSCLIDTCHIAVDDASVDGGVTGACVSAANNYCLVTQFDALQQDCPAVAQTTTVVNNVVSGAVKACTCVYVPTEGNRQMYWADPARGGLVTPGWTTSCAEGEPVSSQPYLNVPIEPCTALAGSLTGTTTVSVIPNATLGVLSCGTAPGEITSFDVACASVNGQSPCPLPSKTGLPCSSNSVATYDVTPETNYGFIVTGYVAGPDGGAPTPLYADCGVFPVFGQDVNAWCDLLGSIDGGVIDGG